MGTLLFVTKWLHEGLEKKKETTFVFLAQTWQHLGLSAIVEHAMWPYTIGIAILSQMYY